jgi:chromate transporter
MVAALQPLLPRLRRSPRAAALLDGVNLGALALIAVVGVQLGRAALVDLPAAAILLAALGLLLGTRLNPTWIVLAAAAAGLLWRG